MEPISSVRDLINLWPKRADLAAELAQEMRRPVSVDQVHKWAQAGSIPPKFQFFVLKVAKGHGFSVDADLMLELHSGLPCGSLDAVAPHEAAE